MCPSLLLYPVGRQRGGQTDRRTDSQRQARAQFLFSHSRERERERDGEKRSVQTQEEIIVVRIEQIRPRVLWSLRPIGPLALALTLAALCITFAPFFLFVALS